MIRTDACAPRKIEKPCEINKNTGDGQIVSLKKKAKTFVVPSQRVVELSVATEAFLYRT